MAKIASKAPTKAPAKKAAAKGAASKSAAAKKAAAGSVSPFVWYDVMTTDMKGAQTFYKSVIGWTAKDSGNPSQKYTLFSAKDRMVAGLMPIPDDAKGMPPMWMGYIGVNDIAAFVKKVKAAGGAVLRGPWEVPGVGRMAVAADPHGAGFMLFQPSGMDPNPKAKPYTPGHIGWHELYAGNLDEAFKFYSKLFGWTKSRAVDMGPMGIYQLFAINGADAGGMMTKPPHVPHPGWGYYISVDALDPAVARVTKSKGKVLNGPMEVPGGMWIAQCMDPQGAMFALVSMKK
jgi:uncharacterized protein